MIKEEIFIKEDIFMKISLIVPIGGNCAYFVHTNLANVAETCGLSFDEFDFVFMTSDRIEPQLQEAFDLASKQYKFRVLKTPVKSKIHLDLLEWAIPHGDLEDWIFLQHMDTFWKPGCKPWLKITQSMIENSNPDHIAIGNYDGHKALLDGKEFTQFYDYAAVVNRKKMVEHNLSFMWGNKTQLKISDKTRKYIDEARFTNKQMEKIHWFDGSVLMGMELAVHYPHLTSKFDYNSEMIHPWSWVRDWLGLKMGASTVTTDKSIKHFTRHLNRYAGISYVSSTCTDLDIPNQPIFPWKLFSRYFPNYTTKKMENNPLIKIMTRYNRPKRTLGLEKSNIKEVHFKDFKMYEDFKYM